MNHGGGVYRENGNAPGVIREREHIGRARVTAAVRFPVHASGLCGVLLRLVKPAACQTFPVRPA